MTIETISQSNSSSQATSEFATQSNSSVHRFWGAVKADAIANGGELSIARSLRLCFMHPGFQLLLIHRIQGRMRLWGRSFSLPADVVLKLGTYLTSCHIYRDVQLGMGIHLPHATGIVIGKGTIIGDNVTIYQNVTLGRRTAGTSGCPELQEGCTIYAGAQILGKVLVGRETTVGGNSVVLESLPEKAVAVGVPARILDR